MRLTLNFYSLVIPLLTPIAAIALCLTSTTTISAADHYVSNGSNVWVEGSWVSCNNSYTWRPGYWQTVQTTVCTTPPPQWVEGQWAQGANGWVWVEGHYQASPTICTTTPSCPPPVVIVQQPPPQVVYTQPCRPQTTVVIGSSVSYGYGHHHGYNNGYGYYNGYNNGNCATYPQHHYSSGVNVGVVVAPSRPVVIRPPSINLPALPRPSSVNIKLPSLPKLPNPFRK